MISVLDALARAFRDLFSLRVLWIVIWPMLLAIVLWVGLGVAFWDTFSGWIAHGLDALGVRAWLTELEPAWIAHAIQLTLHLLLFVPAVLLTALLITALFAMPALIRVVASRDHPRLERREGGSFLGSLMNAAAALVVFVGLWVASLPLWLFGIGVVVPFVAAAWLNQRLFRYDALAEHASADELKTLFRERRGGWWALGLITGLLQFVPLLNLLAPVYAALAFIHYGLGCLTAARAVPGRTDS